MKVDFTKIKIFDINGVQIENINIHKIVANIIYQKANNLDLVDISMEINRGNEVDLSEIELKEVRELLIQPQSQLSAFVRKSIKEFIDNIGKSKPNKEELIK